MHELKKGMSQQRKIMNANQFQMILRVSMQITNGAIGKIMSEGRNGSFDLDYTGNHIAIFECELKVPPALSLIDH
jgi:hypothetical protein